MFNIADDQFKITFDNGYTVSCCIGSKNYCDNRGIYNAEHTCNNCELAVWDENRQWKTRQIFEQLGLGSLADDVAANVDPTTVAEVMAYVATLAGSSNVFQG